MRHLFIINPAAGKKGATEKLEQLLAKLTFEYEVAYTQGPGHARDIAREAAERGDPVRIYACGGDGTLNEVVNGAAGYDHVAVTCVPKGTGNDFLKVFGDDYRTIFYDLEELANGPQTPFDVIDCNGHLGIDMVCCGADARIGAGVHRYKKVATGMMAYCLSLVENVLLKGLTRPMKVEMEDIKWDGETTILCICNGRHYGGGFMPVPDAMPDDGMLDMLLVPGISLFTFAKVVGKYAKGKYRDYPDLIWARRGQSVTFTAAGDNVTVVDGEVVPGTEFTVCISEKKINFFYPAYADYGVKKEFAVSTQSV